MAMKSFSSLTKIYKQ